MGASLSRLCDAKKNPRLVSVDQVQVEKDRRDQLRKDQLEKDLLRDYKFRQDQRRKDERRRDQLRDDKSRKYKLRKDQLRVDKLRNITELHTGSYFMQIPQDILFLIADHLPEEAKAALALTCKILWWNWKHTLSDNKVWAHLFFLLERDIPGVFYCFYSHKLRPITRDIWPERTRFSRPIHWDSQPIRSMIWLGDIELSFYHAHLVMNGHRYGKLHGLPLKALRLCVQDIYPPCTADRGQVVAEMTWTPRIIEGELFLRRTTRMEDLDGTGMKQQQALVVAHRHRSPYELCNEDWKPGKPQEVRDGKTTYVYAHATHSCDECLTAGKYVQKMKKGTESWSMTMKTYYQLGRCEKPDDWKWAGHSHPDPNRGDCKSKAKHDPQADVIKRWKSASRSIKGNG